MKTQTSKTKIWLSSLLLLPIIAILFYSFAEKEYVEKENSDIVEEVKNQLINAENYQTYYVEGASEKLMQEYRDFIEAFEKTKTIIHDKYLRAEMIYFSRMTDAQRATVKPLPESIIPESDLTKVSPKTPNTATFNSWKNGEKYALWLDGKPIKNNVLNTINAEIIKYFTGSFVHNNARSDRFPQPYQYRLYTAKGFKTTYLESNINKYKQLTNRYAIAINSYLKGPKGDNLDLQILYIQALKLYNTLSETERKQHDFKPPPPVPYSKKEIATWESIPKLQIKSDNSWWLNGKETSIASIKEDFVALVGKRKSTMSLHAENPISIEDIEQIQAIVGAQLTSVSFNPKDTIVKDTQHNSKTITVLINRNDQFLINDESGSYESLEALLKKLSNPELYTARFKTDKEASKALINRTLRLLLNYRITIPYNQDVKSQDYNSYNPSFLDYIIEMEKEGASFFLDGQSISVEKAIAIAKTNKGRSTEMLTQKDAKGKYVVKLTSPEKKKIYARSIELQILNDNSYLIDGINATKRTFIDVFNQLHQDITPEVRNRNMNIHVTSSKDISNKETWFIYNSLLDYGFYRIITPNQEINRAKGNTPFAIESQISPQEKPTKKQIAAYNAWAKKINSAMVKAEVSNNNEYPIIKRKDIEKYTRIYSIMSVEQKKKAEAYPDFSKFPPPIAPATGFIEVNGEILFYVHYVPKRFYNKKGYLVDKNGKTINGNTQVNASDILPGQYITRVYQNDKVVVEFKDNQPNRKKMSIDLPLSAPKKNKTLKTLLNNSVEEINSQQQKSGPVEINGATYYFSQNKGRTTYYDRYGKEVDINKIPPPPPIPNDATPEQKVKMKKATDAYMKANPGKVSKIEGENGEVYDVIEVPEDLHGSVDINGETFYYTTGNGKTKYFNRYGKEMKMDNLPPPPPAPPASEATLDFVIRMAKANAKFFYEGKLITSDKAIELLKKNPKLNVNGQKTDTKQPLIYITKKPMLIGVKGKGSKKEKGGPNASHQQALIDFLRKANNQGAILTQIDAQPSKTPFFDTHLTLEEATGLIKSDRNMKLYPYNSPHSGYIVLISNNVENMIPKLNSRNRIEHLNVISSIGAKFYINDEEVSLNKAKRFIKKNPKAEIVSSVNPPFTKINSI